MDIEEIDKKANPGAFSTFDMEVMVPELQKLKKGEIYLEVGVDRGRTLSIAKLVAKKGVKIFGVDINKPPELISFLEKNPDIQFIQGESVFIAKQFNAGKIKLLFIDADHSYTGCFGDINWWSQNLEKGATILFHDCDESSPGVLQAVSEYVNQGKKYVNKFELFKRTDKNTSMAKVELI